jgi:hypothetical protein
MSTAERLDRPSRRPTCGGRDGPLLATTNLGADPHLFSTMGLPLDESVGKELRQNKRHLHQKNEPRDGTDDLVRLGKENKISRQSFYGASKGQRITGSCASLLLHSARALWLFVARDKESYGMFCSGGATDYRDPCSEAGYHSLWSPLGPGRSNRAFHPDIVGVNAGHNQSAGWSFAATGPGRNNPLSAVVLALVVLFLASCGPRRRRRSGGSGARYRSWSSPRPSKCASTRADSCVQGTRRGCRGVRAVGQSGSLFVARARRPEEPGAGP